MLQSNCGEAFQNSLRKSSVDPHGKWSMKGTCPRKDIVLLAATENPTSIVEIVRVGKPVMEPECRYQPT